MVYNAAHGFRILCGIFHRCAGYIAQVPEVTGGTQNNVSAFMFAHQCDQGNSIFVAFGLILKKSVGRGFQMNQAVGESGCLIVFVVIRVKGCGAVVAYQPRCASLLQRPVERG